MSLSNYPRPRRQRSKRRLQLEQLEARHLLAAQALSVAPEPLISLSAWGESDSPAVSGDGQFVVFRSEAANLVPGDTNDRRDLFLYDRQNDTFERVSVNASGEAGNGISANPSVSEDGRFIAFESAASNLVPGDTNGHLDIFVVDRQLGTIERVSVDSSGNESNHFSARPVLSGDGRFVVFESRASNLVADDTNARTDIFVHDRQTRITTRVSVSSAGDEADGISLSPTISGNGRYVAFESDADNLVAGDGNQTWDIFLHDLQTRETTRVSVAADGSEANTGGLRPALSADGSRLAFLSWSTNLVENDTNGAHDVFVRNLITGTVTRVSVDSGGSQANDDSTSLSLSGNGRYVVFESRASNLVPDDTNDATDVFLHDLQTGSTTRVSIATGGAQANRFASTPAVSDDGSIVVFTSEATNLAERDLNRLLDVFLHEVESGDTHLVSHHGPGLAHQLGTEDSISPAISGDGRFVAFTSSADNLVPDDTNGQSDIFLYDRQTGELTRISVDPQGNQADGDSYGVSISEDGRWIAFASDATNLVADDGNGERDIFVYDRLNGTLRRVNVNSDGTEADDYSSNPAISGNGRFVAFESWATNLVAGDDNYFADIFVHDLQTGTTERVSISSTGAQSDYESYNAAISGDGRYVVFESEAASLFGADYNDVLHIFLHDRETGETTLVSKSSTNEPGDRASFAPAISGDGRFIVFSSGASNLVDGDENFRWDIFLFDQQLQVLRRVSLSPEGDEANGDSDYPSISPDGQYIAFTSAASNLVEDDENGNWDIFLLNTRTNAIERLSLGPGRREADDYSSEPSVSRGGAFVAFDSLAANLTDNDFDWNWDVFLAARTNAVPVANASSHAADEDTPLTALLTAADADLDSLTFQVVTLPEHGTLQWDPVTGEFTYQPDENFHGTDSFTFVAQDVLATSEPATVTLNVAAANDPPHLITPVPDADATVQVAFELLLSDAFGDIDGDSLAYEVLRADGSALPAWLSFDAQALRLSGTPQQADVGILELMVRVRDDGSPVLEATDLFQVTISDNLKPWQNAASPLDVNGDGFINPADALFIINELNLNGPGPLSAPNAGFAPPPYYDVTGDNILSAADALLVINFLSAPAPSQAEGESDGAGWRLAATAKAEQQVEMQARERDWALLMLLLEEDEKKEAWAG